MMNKTIFATILVASISGSALAEGANSTLASDKAAATHIARAPVSVGANTIKSLQKKNTSAATASDANYAESVDCFYEYNAGQELCRKNK